MDPIETIGGADDGILCQQLYLPRENNNTISLIVFRLLNFADCVYLKQHWK